MCCAASTATARRTYSCFSSSLEEGTGDAAAADPRDVLSDIPVGSDAEREDAPAGLRKTGADTIGRSPPSATPTADAATGAPSAKMPERRRPKGASLWRLREWPGKNWQGALHVYDSEDCTGGSWRAAARAAVTIPRARTLSCPWLVRN